MKTAILLLLAVTVGGCVTYGTAQTTACQAARIYEAQNQHQSYNRRVALAAARAAACVKKELD